MLILWLACCSLLACLPVFPPTAHFEFGLGFPLLLRGAVEAVATFQIWGENQGVLLFIPPLSKKGALEILEEKYPKYHFSLSKQNQSSKCSTGQPPTPTGIAHCYITGNAIVLPKKNYPSHITNKCYLLFIFFFHPFSTTKRSWSFFRKRNNC